jgi:hypothetical protein
MVWPLPQSVLIGTIVHEKPNVAHKLPLRNLVSPAAKLAIFSE